MRTPALTTGQSALRRLDLLIREDDFLLTQTVEDQRTYSRSHAGWTTRLRLLLRTYAPECTCRYCTICEHETRYSLMFEVEMEREDIAQPLRGHLAVRLDDAAATYARRIRPLPDYLPLRLHRCGPAQIDLADTIWKGTPFSSVHTLGYLAKIRWQDGELDLARECYEAMLSCRLARFELWVQAIHGRIEEVARGVPFEERSSRCSLY